MTGTQIGTNKESSGKQSIAAAPVVSDGADWKQNLVRPAVDTRVKTADVTATIGNDFEDYFL